MASYLVTDDIVAQYAAAAGVSLEEARVVAEGMAARMTAASGTSAVDGVSRQKVCPTCRVQQFADMDLVQPEGKKAWLVSWVCGECGESVSDTVRLRPEEKHLIPTE